MTEATPGPWQVERDGGGRFVVVAPQEDGNLLITDVLANLTPGQDEANAALLARGANNLAPLMEALETTARLLHNSQVGTLSEWGVFGECEHPTCIENRAALLAAREEATG